MVKNVGFWASAEVVENKTRYSFPQSMLMIIKEVTVFEALAMRVSSCRVTEPIAPPPHETIHAAAMEN